MRDEVSGVEFGFGWQPMEPLWNPAGYMRNVIETVRITAA